MRSEDLTHEQCEKMIAELGPTLGYLSRLQERLDRRRWEPTDPMYDIVSKAKAAMHHLVNHLHHESCRARGYGVGQPRPASPRP